MKKIAKSLVKASAFLSNESVATEFYSVRSTGNKNFKNKISTRYTVD